MYKGIIFAMIAWASACMISLAYNIKTVNEHQLGLAIQSARGINQQLTLARQWNRSHNMVYAPITDNFKPSEHILLDRRDITTVEGVKLTMVNSSIMIRQMSDLAETKSGIQFRSVSLNPLNKKSLASPWEAKHLRDFTNESDEYYSFDKEKGEKATFRFIKASIGKAECITCHGKSGYQAGDVIGATSIELPFNFTNNHIYLWYIHFAAMAAGLAGLFFFNKSLKAAEAQILHAKTELAAANSKLLNQNKEMSTDLQVAEKLQKHLFLSHSPPSFLELHVVYNPLSHVSGDLVKMSQSILHENYEIFIGDGSGHGIPAAFTTIMAKMSLDQSLYETSLAKQLEKLNDVFEELLPEDRYLSGILLSINKNGIVRVVNAGHPPLIVLKKSGEVITGSKAGIPLGMFETSMLELAEETFELKAGDRCFLITDGITERLNHAEERYGLHRLIEALQNCKDMNFNQLTASISESMEIFAEGKAPDDDITMIAFEFKNLDVKS